ncbi:chorismate synthase, partial [Fusarium albosuccineum]
LLTIPNEDQRPKDYGNETIDLYPRPSHADWTYLEKYGVKASSGGGRSSARETIGRVAAGAVAEKWLKEAYGIEIVAFVASVGNIKLFDDTDSMSADPAFLSLAETITRKQVDEYLPVRCPDDAISRAMEARIAELRDAHDSTGGSVVCILRNVPAGLGEPCFDKLQATLAHAMMSIPAVKAFEFGSGFRGTEMTGSQHNDPFVPAPALDAAAERTGIPRSKLQTKTNHSGGIQGGISNGMPIFFKVGFKPPATISQDQTTARYDASGEGVLMAKGRHDANVVTRAVCIVEGMAALVIADAIMAQHARQMSNNLVKR